MSTTAKIETTDIKKMDRPWYQGLAAPLILSILGLLLGWGWLNREEYLITPEWGTGYWLGIIGGGMFLLIFTYPLRKKLRLLRAWGPVKLWFNLHMLVGLIAPTIIVFHSNFKLGATNSNVAFYSMILVVISGLVGRYIYSQIHYGLYGSYANLSELNAIGEITREQLGKTFGLAPLLEKKVNEFEQQVRHKPTSLFQSVIRNLSIGFRTWYTYLILRYRLKLMLRKIAKQKGWQSDEYSQFYRQSCRTLAVYLSTIRKIVILSFYERLFSRWHVVHVVFFSMLLLSGIFHVIAVHMY